MIEAIAGPVWTDDTIRRQTGRLYRSALGMTHNATDAEDLVQETFAKALAASGRLQPGTNLAAWLHTIMFNAFVSEYHKRRREPLLATDPADGQANLHWLWDAADCRSAEEQALGRLIEAEIVAAIRALPYSYRIMVYLADVKGLDYRQIASLTGVSIGTVKSSLHRGRHQLRIRLADTLRQEAALPICQMTHIRPDLRSRAGRRATCLAQTRVTMGPMPLPGSRPDWHIQAAASKKGEAIVTAVEYGHPGDIGRRYVTGGNSWA